MLQLVCIVGITCVGEYQQQQQEQKQQLNNPASLKKKPQWFVQTAAGFKFL